MIKALTPRSAFPWHIALLFVLDTFTNAVDYGFHLFIGRFLSPGDFAIVQTANAVLLVVVMMGTVMQPVVAKYGASHETAERQRAVFQQFFRQSGLLGFVLMVLVWLIQRPFAQLLNIPLAIIPLIAVTIWLSLLRPVVGGLLQGQERFLSFNVMRTAFAVGRLMLAVLWIGFLGGQAFAGVAVMPMGTAIALLSGFLFLGRPIWQRTTPLPRSLVWDGWRLSLAALLAYTAHTTLFSLDLIWVNRNFLPDLAGSYAAAVVLRRILLLLPGVVVLIFYPRVVACVKARRLPDGLLLKTGTAVVGSGLLITAVYFAFSPLIITFVFGSDYAPAIPLLGWMGIAMIGYGISAIWLNLFLATRPWPFVGLLLAAAGMQVALLIRQGDDLMRVTAVFTVTGWFLAIGGLALYLLWLRRHLLGSLS
jgi:O-antigen/teichoic acid export membrane protein